MPARAGDLGIDPDAIAAAAYLVRYREPTLTGYRSNLRMWFSWCEAHDVRPLDATRPYLEVWMRELEQRGLKPATINGRLNTVIGFYRFAKLDGYLVDNPADHVRRPKVPKQSSTLGLTRAELLHCLDVARATDPQDHALWCVLALNGPRIGEVCRLDVADLGWSSGYRTVRITRSKSAGRVDEIPLAPRTSRAVDLHLGSRTTGPLFIKPRTPERLDQKSANRIVHRIAKAAGIDKRITPHSLRHTFTTLGLNAGVPLRDLANSRGDADLRQISYYDREKSNLARNATHMISAYVDGA